MPKLKVYALDIDGLHDWAVAAPNQRAALDALGVHQNLFAYGQARAAENPAAIAGALAHPGQAVRKLKGSAAAFAPPADQAAGWQAALKAAPKVEKAGPSKADLARQARIAKAQAALDALEEEADASNAWFERERATLKERAAKTEADFAKRRERLEAALRKARTD